MIIGYTEMIDGNIRPFLFQRLPPDLKKHFKYREEHVMEDISETIRSFKNIELMRNVEPIGYLKKSRHTVPIFAEDVTIKFKDVELEFLIDRAKELKEQIVLEDNRCTNLYGHTCSDKCNNKKRIIDVICIPKTKKIEAIFFEDLVIEGKVCMGYTKKPNGLVETEFVEDISSPYIPADSIPQLPPKRTIREDLAHIWREIFLDVILNCCCFICVYFYKMWQDSYRRRKREKSRWIQRMIELEMGTTYSPENTSEEPGPSNRIPMRIVTEEPRTSHRIPMRIVTEEPGLSHRIPKRIVTEEPGLSNRNPMRIVTEEPGLSNRNPMRIVTEEPGPSNRNPMRFFTEEPGTSNRIPMVTSSSTTSLASSYKSCSSSFMS